MTQLLIALLALAAQSATAQEGGNLVNAFLYDSENCPTWAVQRPQIPNQEIPEGQSLCTPIGPSLVALNRTEAKQGCPDRSEKLTDSKLDIPAGQTWCLRDTSPVMPALPVPDLPVGN